MLFEPYKDEMDYIDTIHKYNNKDYVIIRLTQTMLGKGIIDANVFVQDFLRKYQIMDYSSLGSGEKEKTEVMLLIGNSSFMTTMSCYKAKGRGDQRFWIYGSTFKKMFDVGDLLYMTISPDGLPVIINVSTTFVGLQTLETIFGIDRIADSLSRLLPKVKLIAQKGFHPNSKGNGKISPKDAGDTLESLLGIKANNSQKADFEETIELKTKSGSTLDTLFTLRPRFEGTPVASEEPKDRNRVSAFARYYGYESDRHPDKKSLYITIGSEESPQNNQGFYLEVNEDERLVEVKKSTDGTRHRACYWTFDELETELHQKHPATLWVKVESRMNGSLGEFKYIEAELTRSPQFMTFISLIKTGVITYDWRGYTSPSGKYEGKNHGNAWRVKNKQRSLLFGSSELIDLQSEDDF